MKQSLTVTRLTYLLMVGALLIGVCPLIGVSTAEAQDTGAAANRADNSHIYSIVAQIYEEVFNTGDLNPVDGLIAAEYIDHNPIGPGGEIGIEGFKQTVRALRFAFPDLHFTIEEILVNGDKVVVRTTMRGLTKIALWELTQLTSR